MRQRIPLLCGLGLVSMTACGAPSGTSESLAHTRAAVVFGDEARASEIRGTVALVDANQGFPFCSGTLIAPDVVLTAAHCLVIFDDEGFITGDRAPSDIVVASGVTNVGEANRSDITFVSEAIYHPTFARNPPTDPALGFGNLDDIGVLLLAQDIENATPVPVLAPADIERGMPEGSTVIVEGFGTADPTGTQGAGILRLADVPLVRVGEDEFVAGRTGTADACPGDSGGPVYVELDGVLHVVGVTSRSLPGSETRCGGGGIYTLASAYADFLSANAPVSIPEQSDTPTDEQEPRNVDEDQDQDQPARELPPGEDAPQLEPDEENVEGDVSAPTTPGARTAVGGCSVTSEPAGSFPVFLAIAMSLYALRSRRSFARVKGT